MLIYSALPLMAQVMERTLKSGAERFLEFAIARGLKGFIILIILR